MIDWEGLFTEIGVSFRRRGANTSRKDINICCPWCGDDYGYHLGISLSQPNYYCFRDPGEHSGKHLPHLLMGLGVPNHEIDRLLAEYDTEAAIEPPPPPPLSDLILKWNYFEPLQHSSAHLRYMQEERGFPNVEEVAKLYDLRYAPQGKWAQRVLFPIRVPIGGDKADLVSWTGRAIKPSMQPKYLMQSTASPELLYIPRPLTNVVVLLEGPLDALKFAAAVEDASSIAILGKALMTEKLAAIRRIFKHFMFPDYLILALDSDVPDRQIRQTAANLKPLVYPATIIVSKIPNQFKDVGAMSYSEICSWVESL